MNFFILINLFEKQEQPAPNNFKFYWKKWDVSFLESFHLCELLRKENNAFKKTWMQVKNSLERNLRSINVLFRGKKQKKNACIETESVASKMKFFRWSKYLFQGKTRSIELNIKTSFSKLSALIVPYQLHNANMQTPWNLHQ